MVGQKIAIIPARSGSKRIPRKNILDFNGKPLIAWTILAALESEQFDRVVVSTDSEEIANLSKAFGASVPFLRTKFTDDFSNASSATLAALHQSIEYWGEEYHWVTQLMPNCPLRDSSDIVNSMLNFNNKLLDFQISSFKFGWMNPWWAFTRDEAGEAKAMFPEAFTRRSQDLPLAHCPTGAIWIARTEKLLDSGSFYGPGHKFFDLNWDSAIDIDSWDDYRFALVAAKFKEMGQSN